MIMTKKMGLTNSRVVQVFLPNENDTPKTWLVKVYLAGGVSVALHGIWTGFFETSSNSRDANHDIPFEIRALIRGLLWPILYIPPIVMTQYKKLTL